MIAVAILVVLAIAQEKTLAVVDAVARYYPMIKLREFARTLFLT